MPSALLMIYLNISNVLIIREEFGAVLPTVQSQCHFNSVRTVKKGDKKKKKKEPE